MERKELTEDELGRVVLMSIIPMVIVALVIFFLYPVSFKNLGDTISMEAFVNSFSVFILWFLPVLFMTFFLTFEILYHTKIRKPLFFHVKRFVGRVIFGLVFSFLLVGIMDILCILLFSFVSIKIITTVSLLIASLAFGIVVWKFRHLFSRLDKGDW